MLRLEHRRATAAIALLALACASAPPRTGAPPPGESEPPAPIVTVGPALAPPVEPAEPEPELRLFGRIAGIDATDIELDEAEFLTGAAANEAAVAAGEIEPGQTAYNDYFIRDGDSSLRRMPLAAVVKVDLLPRSSAPDYTIGTVPEPSSLVRLRAYHAGSDPHSKVIRSQYFHVTVRKGQVVRIEEMFLP